jgi:hypothetical protein
MKWEELYAATVIETRPEQLRVLIAETKRCLSLRLNELARETDTVGERLSIEHALSVLEILMSELE